MGARGRFARFAKVRRKPDANQASIFAIWRRCGASVLDLSGVGGGCPDALVGYRGRDQLAEIKTATGEPNEGQEDFARDWKGCRVAIVRTEADALAMLGIRLDT